MIPVWKDLNNGMVLHKEKERIRHRKQVELLNKVMEQVPASSNRKKTKVKNLRNLILYTYYLKMVHSELFKEFDAPSVDNTSVRLKELKATKKPASEFRINAAFKRTYKRRSSKFAYNSVSKPACKAAKVLPSQEQQHRKAHIVFLHAVKPVKPLENLENPISSDTEPCYNFENSPLVFQSGCKTPDIVLFQNKIDDNMNFNQESVFSQNSNNIQLKNSIAIPSYEYEISPYSTLLDQHETVCNELKSNTSDMYLFSSEIENLPLIADSISVNYVEKIPAQNISNIDENSVKSCCNVSQKFPDNYILKDLTLTKTASKVQEISKTDIPNQNYVLDSFEVYPVKSVSDIFEYPFQGSVGNYTSQTPSLANNNFFLADYCLNSADVNPLIHHWSSTQGNSSDSSNSSLSTDNMVIDVDNVSDSNTTYTNLSGSTNSFNIQDNFHVSPKFYCDNINLTTGPFNETISPKNIQNDSTVIPSYFENLPLENEILFTPVCDISQSYFGNIHPTKNSAIILPSEPVHSLSGGNTHFNFVDDHNSLYSPSGRNSHSEFLSLSVKSELINTDDFQKPCQESDKPFLFEEETSHVLSEYFKNC